MNIYLDLVASDGRELRLTELGIAPDIVMAARVHPSDLPEKQQRRIEEYISSLEEELAESDRFLAGLDPTTQRHTHALNSDQAKGLRQRIHGCKSILSIGRRLPVETLGQIFEEYIKLDNQDEQPVTQTAGFRPRGHLLLLLVCHWWRSVALGHHGLWCPVILRAQYQWPGDPPLIPTSLVPGILARIEAVHKPFWTLHIDAVPRRDFKSYSFVHEARTPLRYLFARHPAACATLVKLSVSAVQYAVGLHGVVFPNVTSLVVQARLYELEGGKLKVIEGRNEHDGAALRGGKLSRYGNESLPTLPALVNVVLEGVLYTGPNAILHPENVRWGQLTHLALGYSTRQEWRTLIRKCINLVKGVFKLAHKVEKWYEPGDPFRPLFEDEPPELRAMPHAMYGGVELVVLGRLKELALFGVSPFVERSAISPEKGLRFPLLDKLRLFLDSPSMGSRSSSRYWDFQNARGLFPHLTHLTLVGDIDGKEAVRVLSTVEGTLEEVFVRVSGHLEGFLEYLKFDEAISRFNAKKLRALGVRMAGMVPYWEPHEQDDLFQVLDSFLHSRVANLTSEEVPEQGFELVPLKTFVFHGEVRNKDEKYAVDKAKEIIARLRPLVEKYRDWGMKVSLSVRGKDDAFLRVDTEMDKHWDEGYGGIFQGKEYEYSLDL